MRSLCRLSMEGYFYPFNIVTKIDSCYKTDLCVTVQKSTTKTLKRMVVTAFCKYRTTPFGKARMSASCRGSAASSSFAPERATGA